ncbi:MAG: DUF3305 domain-containing protein [Gammaproteobacteria bacterium]|nr:DUF3305 domain-containing protein [Gammaproteobacteria bacterium]
MNSEIKITESDAQISIAVAVVIERTETPQSKWGYPVWKVFAVIAGEHIEQYDQSMVIHDEGKSTRFYWGGLSLNLYKDGSEGYWYNLLSDVPYLFVVCDGEEGAHEIEPSFVTANQDEANASMESDDMVLSIPMPIDIRELVERYVISHYSPEQKKKRKRKEWIEESQYAKRQAKNFSNE